MNVKGRQQNINREILSIQQTSQSNCLQYNLTRSVKSGVFTQKYQKTEDTCNKFIMEVKIPWFNPSSPHIIKLWRQQKSFSPHGLLINLQSLTFNLVNIYLKPVYR